MAEPGLLRLVSPRLIVEEAPKETVHGTARPASVAVPVAAVVSASGSGAVTLRFYTRSMEAHGFVDGRSLEIPH